MSEASPSAGSSSAAQQAATQPGEVDYGAPSAPLGSRPATRTAAQTLRKSALFGARDESDKALGIGVALAAPVVVLLALAGIRASGDALPNSDVWISGHLAMLSFLIAGQFVCALLAREHLRTIEEIGTGGPAPKTGLTGRVLALAATIVLITITLLSGMHPLTDWTTLFWIAAAGEVVALAFLVLSKRATATKVKEYSAKALPDLVPQAPPPEPDPPAPGELIAIGASGGGIRAAAFVLGGVNAIQSAERYSPAQATATGQQDQSEQQESREPEVFAVSGGSYTAAALALRRRFGPDGTARESENWRNAYVVGSPELDYLRRRTRYLFEPGTRLRDGAISLLVGATVNLFIVAALLRGTAWATAQFAVTSGVVTVDTSRSTPMELHAGRLLLTVLGIAVALVTIGTVGRWFIHRKFDRGQPTDDDDTKHMGWLSRLRTKTLVATTVAVLLLAVPTVTTVVVHATTHNSPNALVASLLRISGFATPDMCVKALNNQAAAAVESVSAQAALSPGTEHSTDIGACGVTIPVSRTLESAGDTPAPAAPISEEVMNTLTNRSSTTVQVGTILALLSAVVGFLTRGPAMQTAGEGRLIARIGRSVLTWAPLVIVSAIGIYLLLLWHLQFVLGLGSGGSTWANVIFIVAAGVVAFFLDANSTSMHQYYRERLSSAFAVGVNSTGTAKELPDHIIYRFSALEAHERDGEDGDDGAKVPVPAGPRLNVVTTLNTQTPHETPTLRGGMPLVFAGRTVAMHDTMGLDTAVQTGEYEKYAGPGRTSIMATVAMSGAAVSPLMGRKVAEYKSFRILLTLFNIRVGMWMLNPAQTILIGNHAPGHTDLLAVTSRPGAFQVVREAIGRSSMRDRWVYVSDGGHLDNTSMVECVRHAARRTPPGEPLRGQVVVLDASNDPPGTWADVGDALNVIRADLGIDLVRKFTEGEPPWVRQFVERRPGVADGAETFHAIVVKAVRVEPPTGAPSAGHKDWYRDLPEPVKSTQFLRPDFPRASTARQRFGDLEFEAYRAYGYAAVSEALAFLDDPDA